MVVGPGSKLSGDWLKGRVQRRIEAIDDIVIFARPSGLQGVVDSCSLGNLLELSGVHQLGFAGQLLTREDMKPPISGNLHET
jgi:hypothetical protein